MKNKISILVMLLLIGTSVFSQVKVRPGVRLAVNVSNISGLDDSSFKTGLNIGVFGNVHFSDLYELQLELSYSNQGANIVGDIIEETFDEDDFDVERIIGREEVKRDIEYFSIGIMNKLFVANTGFHFIIGPSIDITHDNDAYFGALFPAVDIAVTGGIGYEFPFGLAIEARYKRGLTHLDDDLFTPSNSNFSDTFISFNGNGDYFNTVFQFGLSYKFDFNRKK